MKKQSVPRLGIYRVIDKVGAGGLGSVYKAINETTGKTVAIKVLHPKFISDRRFLGIFHRELLIVSGLHHTHIVSYLDSYFKPPECYIVTEFIDGWSGHGLLKMNRNFPPLIALSILIEILIGLDYLHLHDTIHSDLSAANYMLDKSGQVYVNDFGLSCKLDIEDYKDYMVGTPGYYSPEHITENSVVPQSDIYSAGLLLYEMIVGEKAVVSSKDRNQIIGNMKKIDFSRINIIKDRKMRWMTKRILKHALQFKVSNRYSVVEEMIYDCYRVLDQSGIRFPKQAIRKYLVDVALIKGPFDGVEQNIYQGASK